MPNSLSDSRRDFNGESAWGIPYLWGMLRARPRTSPLRSDSLQSLVVLATLFGSPLLAAEPTSGRDSLRLEAARREARSVALECPPEGCPEAVGVLAGVQPASDSGWGTYQCTAFLTDSVTILTNRHCVPRDLQGRLPGEELRGRMWVRFPGAPGASIEVAALAARSARKDSTGLDWAQLRLDVPVGRSPLRLSGAGMRDGQLLTAWMWDPVLSRDGRGGRMRKAACRVVNGSPVTRFGTGDPQARSVLLEDCAVRVGNSGSPLLDSGGAAVGLVDGLFDPTQAALGTLLAGVRLLDGKVAPLGQATNLACATLAGEPERKGCPLPERVAVQPYRGLAELLDTLERTAPGIPGLRNRALLLDTGNSPALFLQLRKGMGSPLPELFAVAAPACVSSPARALSGWRNPWWKLWIGHREEGQVELEVPAWPVLVGVDERARLAARRRPGEVPVRLRFSFRPAQLERTRETAFAIELREDRPGIPWIPLARGTLGVCAP